MQFFDVRGRELSISFDEGKQTIVVPAAALEAFGDAFKLLKGGS